MAENGVRRAQMALNAVKKFPKTNAIGSPLAPTGKMAQSAVKGAAIGGVAAGALRAVRNMKPRNGALERASQAVNGSVARRIGSRVGYKKAKSK